MLYSDLCYNSTIHLQQDSPDTPGKKTKLYELQTPQPKKTSAVGSPSLRRKSMEPTKPKVLFTGVIDEHGQKVLVYFTKSLLLK